MRKPFFRSPIPEARFRHGAVQGRHADPCSGGSKGADPLVRSEHDAYVILGCISIYGCVAFVQRGFPGYMSGKTAFAFFDYGEPIILKSKKICGRLPYK